MDQDENPNRNYRNERVQKPVDPALSYGSSVLEEQVFPSAPRKKPAPPAPPPGPLKQAQTLMISDGTETERNKKLFKQTFAKHSLKIPDQDHLFVNSWIEFVTKLQEYATVVKLVIFTHAIEGGIGIGGEFKDLGVIADRFTGQPTPKINEINFEGCNLANFSDIDNVDGLVKFVNTFSTSKFSAWSYFHVTVVHVLNYVPNSTVQLTAVKLAPWEGYLIPGTPTPAQFFSLKANQPFGVEWFRSDLNEEDLPMEKALRRLFKKRGDATPIIIRGTGVQVRQGLIDRWRTYNNLPIKPFENLIVEIT